jgi:PKD repeat protein
MKNLRYFIFLAIACLVLTISGCKKDDTSKTLNACFNTGNANELYIRNAITFSNCSQNAVSYTWNFGDGTTSTLENPSHAFDTTGIFTVTLTATDNSSHTDTYTQNVTIGDGSNINQNPGSYTHVYITGIQLLSFPMADNVGQGWDGPLSYPDVYVQIASQGVGTSTYSNYVADANSGNYIFWDYSSNPYELLMPQNNTFTVAINLYDRDIDINGNNQATQMAYIPNANFYSPAYYGKPNVTLTQGSFSIKLNLQWQ